MKRSKKGKSGEFANFDVFMSKGCSFDRFFNLSDDGVFHCSTGGNINFAEHMQDGEFFNPSDEGNDEERSHFRKLFEMGYMNED